MKTRLNELSLSQFICLVCGENTVLLDIGEDYDEEFLSNQASELIASYRQITDKANFCAWLLEQEEILKNKFKVQLFRICHVLLDYELYAEVRSLLGMAGENVDNVPDEELSSKMEQLLNFLLFEMRRNEDMKGNEDKKAHSFDEIRAAFDEEIAFLMTYFKMPIDMNSVNAAIYANMVHQADMEIKNRRLRA